MPATKVLVVDDSLTMRALISNVLSKIKNVDIVGLADGAAEAREMVAEFKPDVMTLDIEMPVTSGLEYLAELMEKNPMPVIMFSTRTLEGTDDSIEALRIGAVDCFPKPQVASQQELDGIIAKLGKRIQAAKGTVRKGAKTSNSDIAPIDWNGRVVVIGGDASSTSSLFNMLSTFPENCPPTILVQHMDKVLVEGMARKLGEQVKPKVQMAEDGMTIEQGNIYLAPAGDSHVVIDSWPEGKLRMLARDPVAGERPSISLLFASAAKAAAAQAIGVLLLSGDEDGQGGVNAMLSSGAYAISPAESGDGYTLGKNMATQPIATDDLAANIIKMCAK